MQQEQLEKAFEKHIRENEPLLHKVCRVYAFTDSDRQDLFQEIVIQLWQAYPGFKAQAKLSTWIYRVAINTAITGLRKRKDFISTCEPASLPTHLPDDLCSAETEERMHAIYKAIEQLNAVEKAIVLLYLEDHSYETMEEILGMSQGNLRVKMSRIKDKLRQLTKNA